MGAGGGNLHSALGPFLPLHIGKVEREERGHLRLGRAGRLYGRTPHEKGYRLSKRLCRIDGKPLHNGGLSGVFRSGDEPPGLLVTSKQGKREHAGHRLEPAVQRKFRRREPAFKRIRRNDACGREKPESQRQVVGRAFLAPVRRSKVHRDAGGWQFEAGVLQSFQDSLAGFAHSTFGKAYHHERGHALPAAVHLQVDPVGVYAMKSSAGKPNDHISLTG